MIAYAGAMRLAQARFDYRFDYRFDVKPRWNLVEIGAVRPTI